MHGNKLHCVSKQTDWIMPGDTRREDEKISSSFPKDIDVTWGPTPYLPQRGILMGSVSNKACRIWKNLDPLIYLATRKGSRWVEFIRKHMLCCADAFLMGFVLKKTPDHATCILSLVTVSFVMYNISVTHQSKCCGCKEGQCKMNVLTKMLKQWFLDYRHTSSLVMQSHVYCKET